MKPHTPTLLVTAVAALALGACSQSPAPAPSGPAGAASAAGTSAPVIAAPPASPGTAGLPGDHAETKHYKIAITLPNLPANEQPLADALRTTADNAKREFVQALPDPEQLPEFADRQFELLLDFKIAAHTPTFTSVRETGMQATGGAHPIPVEAAFVFDRKAGKLIALDGLFADADAARTALANFAHDTLLTKFTADAPKPGDGSSPDAIREWKSNMVQMLNEGTKPTTVNYSIFVVRAGAAEEAPSPGLTLVFPPYQVAPYVYGTQTVDVPASVFARFLKPGYRGAFAAH
ncbi:MAG TPA: RsiV family protein [Rhodanobacteraceae bacterium]|nr:RsiV family protein [Rhodanobacteraceae bacterium]